MNIMLINRIFKPYLRRNLWRKLSMAIDAVDINAPHSWYTETRRMKRNIICHLGPTNSGKTYTALERLKQSKNGVYCGPLRLLAWEVCDKLRSDGIRCNLLTGNEQDFYEDPIGTHTSSTIEMVELNKYYEVAVIDEAQLIGDSSRGWAWTNAILGIKAKEIHLCGSPIMLPIIQKLIEQTKDSLHINYYERLSPLLPKETPLESYKQIKNGDCVIGFSRRDLFRIKKKIEAEKPGMKCCVIYGGLPPEARKVQAQLFSDPHSGYNVLVASDAIGMGLNLAIKRIIFSTIEKFDGISKRYLTSQELKQIAGRAGRYGTTFNKGEVLCMSAEDIPHMISCLSATDENIETAGLFPSYEQLQLLRVIKQYPVIDHQLTDFWNGTLSNREIKEIQEKVNQSKYTDDPMTWFSYCLKYGIIHENYGNILSFTEELEYYLETHILSQPSTPSSSSLVEASSSSLAGEKVDSYINTHHTNDFKPFLNLQANNSASSSFIFSSPSHHYTQLSSESSISTTTTTTTTTTINSDEVQQLQSFTQAHDPLYNDDDNNNDSNSGHMMASPYMSHPPPSPPYMHTIEENDSITVTDIECDNEVDVNHVTNFYEHSPYKLNDHYNSTIKDDNLDNNSNSLYNYTHEIDLIRYHHHTSSNDNNTTNDSDIDNTNQDNDIVNKYIEDELYGSNNNNNDDKKDIYLYYKQQRRNLKWSKLYKLLSVYYRESTQLSNGLYFICNMEDTLMKAKLLDKYNELSLLDKYIWSKTPIDVYDNLQMEYFEIYIQQYIEHKHVMIWIEHIWKNEPPRTAEALLKRESIHNILEMYIWLGLRYPTRFLQVVEAREYCNRSAQLIEIGLKYLGKYGGNVNRKLREEVKQRGSRSEMEVEDDDDDMHKNWRPEKSNVNTNSSKSFSKYRSNGNRDQKLKGEDMYETDELNDDIIVHDEIYDKTAYKSHHFFNERMMSSKHTQYTQHNVSSSNLPPHSDSSGDDVGSIDYQYVKKKIRSSYYRQPSRRGDIKGNKHKQSSKKDMNEYSFEEEYDLKMR